MNARRIRWLAGVMVMAALLGACARGEPEPPKAAAPAPAHTPPQAGSSEAVPSARKVVRKAELELEVSSLRDAEERIAVIVEREAGYVAEASRLVRADEARSSEASLVLVLRVPARRFMATIAELKRLGTGDVVERIGSEDVTDAFIDVEAAIANQRRLEQRLAELLERAENVDAALRVQRELSIVRTEIDRGEGRRRLLENESALSTLRVTLATARPLASVSLASFGVSARTALRDAIAIGAALVIGMIRLAGYVLPLALLAAPVLALARRAARRRRAAPMAGVSVGSA